jgi:arylsulfatase A-like enzyme
VHLFDAHERYEEHPGIRFGKGKMGAYDGEIAFVDQQLGALAKAIAESPRANRTALVVHGSHGEGFAEHGVNGHGSELYDEMIRVPLILVLPGGKPSRYGSGAVSTLDVAPTVLALGGADSDGVAGVSLLPLVTDPAKKHGSVYARTRKRSAVIDWPIELLTIERKHERTFLFDLGADPGPTKDLSSERPDAVTHLLEVRRALEQATQKE